MESAGVGNVLLRIRREQKQDQDLRDQEDQEHVDSIIESIETLLIMDDDKAFNQTDPDLMEMPEDLPGPVTDKGQIEEEASPIYSNEFEQVLESVLEEFVEEKESKQAKENNKREEPEAGAGTGAGAKEEQEIGAGEIEAESGEEETVLILAPSWKGDASCTKCNLFPALVNSEVWRKEGPR